MPRPPPLRAKDRSRLILGEYRGDRFEDSFVDPRASRDDTAIAGECRTAAEVERLALDIADAAAGLLDDDHAAGMVPNLLLVARPRRQPQICVGLPTGDDRILRLRIQANRIGCRRRRAAMRGVRVRAVARLDGLADPNRGRSSSSC